MAGKSHLRASDLRGAGRLAVQATLGLTSLVETLHHNILRTPGVLGKATQKPAGGLTGFVYKSIRGITRAVGGGVDAVLGQLARLLDGGVASSPQREAVVAALNGVLGDHLASTGNPLAIAMCLRRDGQALDLSRQLIVPAATGKIVLLVHGLCMNDLQWRRGSFDYGAALAADAGFTPLYLHYNSGTHISTNGADFADLIETLLSVWPVPVEHVTIVAHSMGGLLARSACRHARTARHAWFAKLRTMIFLGTPHLGAPLERGGHWIDVLLDASPYTTAFARLGKIRSAGITDLHHGNLCDEDWQQQDRFARSRRKPRPVPLPEGVACHALAASIAKETSGLAKRLLGDGLVPLPSALGKHTNPRRSLHLPKDDQVVFYGMNHMQLLHDRRVYARIKGWLLT